MIRSVLTAGMSLSVAATGLLMASPSQANLAAAAGSGTTATHFAMEASGYSTRISGGQLPAGSDRTAFQVIACTNKAGITKENHEAAVNFLPLLRVGAAQTNVRTTEKNGVVTSWARNTIAKVTLGDRTLGNATPTINGITSTSRAYHNGTGFHASTRTTVVAIDTNGSLPGGKIAGPTRGNPVTLKGVATISVGRSDRSVGVHGASAEADALSVKLLTGTVIKLAHSRATISDGVVEGVFKGSSYGSKVQAAGGAVTSKMTPYTVMPCQGTHGKIVRKDVTRINPKGLILRGLTASEKADQKPGSGYGWERGRVARLNLGSGALVVRGVVGQANVRYVKGKGISTSIKGSTILGISAGGQSQTIPRSGVLRIRGVAKLEQNVVHRTKKSIEVTALRITVLDGTGAVINLGHAKVGFSKSNF